MTRLKAGDIIGYSNSSINEAIQDALRKVKELAEVVVIETKGQNKPGDGRQYHVTLSLVDKGQGV